MALTDTQFNLLREQLRKRQQESSPEEYKSFLQRAAESAPVEEAQPSGPLLRQVGTGAAKEIGSTAIGLGTLGRGIQKGLSKGIDAVFGTKNFGLGKESIFDKGSESNVKATELFTPKGGAEKTGAFLTEAATFAIPGGAAVKATKGANFLTRVASLGASDALVTGVQKGEFDKDSVDAAIIGMAFPLAGRGASLAKNLLPSGADAGGRVINSLIKPLLKDFSYGKNPGKAVAEAGITASTLDELAVNIKKVRQETGQLISDKVKANTTRFNATDALSSIDEAIVAAQKAPKTNASIINRLQAVKDDLLQIGEDGIPKRNLKDMSADELWEFNKEIGDLARWTGNASDDEITNAAIRKAYGATRSKLDNAVEGLSETSEKYANLKSAEVATEYRDKIAARQGLISLTGSQAGIGLGIVTAITTGGVTLPLILGAGAAGLTEAAKTPAVKTKLASWLASASKDELKQAFTEAPWLRGTLQSILLDVDETKED
jgi:hypothetical protein